MSKRNRSLYEADSPSSHSPYVFFGTPLPAYDPHARDDGSYLPLWKQEVRDERGRKRLHGAFTGGWSAGYFNTVGSKEGWTPSTFVSSRQNRARDRERQGTDNDENKEHHAPTTTQRPEDFMDEEDIRDAEESRLLQTTARYTGFGGQPQDEHDVFGTRAAGFMQLFKTTGHDTVGVKLLRRMGWREGQGIGPRVRRRARLGGDDDEEEENGERHLFAPENTPMIAFNRKEDKKGLGFAGEERLTSVVRGNGGEEDEDEDDAGPFSRLALKPGARKTQLKKGPMQRRIGGIGTGVLNSDDEDEEDPYEIAPRLSYNRVIEDKKAKKKQQQTKTKALENAPSGRTLTANPLLSSKPVFIKRKPGYSAAGVEGGSTSGFRKCHDGRLPLDGFVLSTALSNLSLTAKEKLYPAPEIPPGWESSKRKTEKGKEKEKQGPTDPSTYQSPADAAKQSTLTPSSRAQLLGEEQLPGLNIFDYITPEARARIVAATGRTDLPPARGQKAAPTSTTATPADAAARARREDWGFVPYLDARTASQALETGLTTGGPYADNEGKRGRYRRFLLLKAGLGEQDKLPERAEGMSAQEWIGEMREFVRCAEVFRPVRGLMAARFTSASTSAGAGAGAAGNVEVAGNGGEGLLRRPKGRQLTAGEEAARMGMFGQLTREVKSWRPSQLLCKRFGVVVPEVSEGDEQAQGQAEAPTASMAGNRSAGTASGTAELLSTHAMEKIIADAQRDAPRLAPGQGEPGLPAPTLGLRKPVSIDPERNEALEAERPGEEVFRAVFGSDDEGEDEGGLDD